MVSGARVSDDGRMDEALLDIEGVRLRLIDGCL